jgi:hypothetical protein
MNYHISRQFAGLLLSLAPDFSLCMDEIVERIKTQGLDGFIKSVDSYTDSLFKVVRLLSSHEKGDKNESQ